MFEPTPEQAQLIALIVFFLPLLVQGIRKLAALANVGLPTGWIRVLVGATAVLVLALTAIPAFSVPPASPALTVEYVIALLVWAEGSFILLSGFVTTAHLLYEHIWRRAFESDVPVLNALASENL